jgi:hypothetical protein
MRIPTILALGVATSFVVFGPPMAGAQSCTPADTTLTPPLNEIKGLVVSTRATDVATRQRLSIPTVDSSEVSVVSDTRVCDKVLAAFRTSFEAGIRVPTKLFVMKVGTTYVALYPESGIEADIYRVLSNKYAILSKFAK